MNSVFASSVVASVWPSLTLRPTTTPSIGARIVVRSRSISATSSSACFCGSVAIAVSSSDSTRWTSAFAPLDLVLLRRRDGLRLAQGGFGGRDLRLRILEIDGGADLTLAQRFFPA